MITIDGRQVEARGTVLDACRAAGADVPAFCSDDRLGPGGHCRSCMVSMDGRMVAACTTPAHGGTTVETSSPRLEAYRRDLGELMISESVPGGWVATVLGSWHVDGSRYGRAQPRHARDETHPYLRLDMDRCILCRRCVRACEQVQGQFVYAVAGRGHTSHLTWATGAFVDTDCVSCGACVSACPTGAITDRDRERDLAVEQTVRTTCGYCGVGCQLDVASAGDAIAWIDGASSPVNHQHLCVKGRYAHAFTRHPERLTQPLIRRGDRLEPASWDAAVSLVAERFAALRGRVAGLSSSRCTNEENYLFQKWMRAGLGTNDVDCCARVCHAPTAAGMRMSLGTGAATNSLSDIDRADLLLVVGANMTEAHPVTGARVKQAALRGATLVVIDPRCTELAAVADLHLQLRPGTNVPLFNSLASALVEGGFVDGDFVEARVEGWPEFARFICDQTPERWADVTGVPARLVREAARLYGTAARPLMTHGLGVTEHYQGSEAVRLLCNLALLRGAIGREGVGVNPLRGQNNVQGAADMGCQPDALTGYAPIVDAAARERFEAVWRRDVPPGAGRVLPEMYDAARRHELRGLFILGEDVLQSDPDLHRTREALEALDFLVVQELFLSETAKLAHVVLPGASFLEKDGTFTNGERRIQRVRKVIDPPGDAHADWEILCVLMAATGYPQQFRGPSEIMDEIATVNPAFGGVSYERLDAGGLQWPVPKGSAGTPVLHASGFPRPGNRAALACVEFVPSPTPPGALTLITGRVLEHYNAGTMTRRTPNLSLVTRDWLDIHPSDADSRGIATDDPVCITSAQGTARARARVTSAVAPGTLFLSFHFPETEANAVTSDVRDRVSSCPEYKLTGVEVVRDTASA
jgi:formate dehydrogenase major subunit